MNPFATGAVSISAANSTSGIATLSAFDVVNAIIAKTFLGDAPVEIYEIDVGVKPELTARLIDPVARGPT